MEMEPPSLPPIPPNVTPQSVSSVAKRVPMARRGYGTKGQKVQLLTNHFRVNLSKTDGCFYQYSVSLKYEDNSPADAKGVGRRIMDQIHETYKSELAGKDLAYDGDKTLFTLGALPKNKLEFTVVLDDLASNRNIGEGSPGASPGGSPNNGDRKRSKRQHRSKTYIVTINYATKIPMQAIADALHGNVSESFQEAVRVLDIILLQNAAKQGCLLVRQSFFHNEPRNFVDLGGGVNGCRGIHSSFRATQGGLSLNMDVSTTMIVKPGPVIDFLLENQGVRNPNEIDWSRAKKMLKGLRIVAIPTNRENKITGLSDKPCAQQTFLFKQRTGKDGGEDNQVEITVLDYFANRRGMHLRYSGNYPCINVGKPKRPNFIPIELCSLVSLQRYTKSLSNFQRASLVEKSRQKPPERMKVLNDALIRSNYNAEPLLKSSGISISNQLTQVEGRVLQAPKLIVGNGDQFFPRNGKWNFNQKHLVEPVKIERWAAVNFSARCDVRKLCRDLHNCGQGKGVMISPPFEVFEEDQQLRRAPAPVRVDKMIEMLKSKLPGPPQFILCVLPERKNCDIYGPWKRKNLTDLGVATQCIAPTRVNDQYLTNVLLKINAKLGGMNSLLAVEHSPSIPLVSKVPTIIVGMDVSHGSPGRADVPSIAAVVSSRGWPHISRYRASVRTQSPKLEMIESLYNKVSDTEDKGIFRELVMDFYISSGKQKPEHIIIFRDGVSESQFKQVLNIEFEQIIEACKFLDEKWSPKFTVIVAQKNHHTKFFLDSNSPNNVLPGTVIDNGICHPKNNDFYMCAHAGMIGTTRPTHYQILHDEIGFSPDALQELVHSLSYVYQRSTTAISVVAPICYAHLAAAQVGQFMKFDEFSDTSSSHGGTSTPGASPISQLPPLHDRVKSSMFFC